MKIKEEIRKNIANDISRHPGLTQRARDVATHVITNPNCSLESPDNIGFLDTEILKDNFGICRHVPILPLDLLNNYNRIALEFSRKIRPEVFMVDELCSYDSRFSKTGLLCKPDFNNVDPWSSYILNPRRQINEEGYFGIG